MDLRSNLSKARGLGSAKEGANHWWMQRVTAIALIPLVLWFVQAVIKATALHGVAGVVYLLSSPFNAIAMILFLGTAIYHGTLGVKVIIEDYVHCPCGSKFLDIATKFIAVVSIVAVTFTIFYANLTTYGNPERFHEGFWKGNKINETGSVQKDNSDAPVIEVETPKE